MAVISECRNHSDGDSVVLGSTLVIPECKNHSGGDSVVLGSTLVDRDLNAVRRAQ